MPKTITIELSDEICEEFKEKAKILELSVEEVICILIADFINSPCSDCEFFELEPCPDNPDEDPDKKFDPKSFH